jgi:hypothetical protein
MKKYFLLVLVCIGMIIAFSGCNNDNQEVEKVTKDSEKDLVEEETHIDDSITVTSKDKDDSTKASGLIKCGEVYHDKHLSYSVIGVRINEYNSDTKSLILKLEVYNHSDDDINYSTLDTLALFNEANVECSLDIWADVNGNLGGTITPENKIIGEVAFDITDNESSNYCLHIGEWYEYVPAIEVSTNDIDMIFAEQFEATGVNSEYVIGVPVKSSQLDILVNNATIVSSNKEGLDVLLIDLSVTNNDSDDVYFTGGINLNGVYTSNGEQLEVSVNEWTFPNDSIKSHETTTGVISYYIAKGESDFYMTVTPNLDNFNNKENIILTADATISNSEELTRD